MIAGIVNAEFEPIIPLSVCGSDGKVYTQTAIVDITHRFKNDRVLVLLEKNPRA